MINDYQDKYKEITGKEISFFGRNQESSCAEDCISDCSDYGGRSVCA